MDTVEKNAHNKAVQTDNLRGVVCVHGRFAPILAHKRHRINCGWPRRYEYKTPATCHTNI